MAWCRKFYPLADDKTMIFALHNLPADAVVEWDVTLGDEFDEVIGPTNLHVVTIVSRSGSGSVSATVNGEPIGSAPYDYDLCPE